MSGMLFPSCISFSSRSPCRNFLLQQQLPAMSLGHWEVHIPSWKGTACKRDDSWGSPNTGPSLGTQNAHFESQLGDNALIQRFPNPAPSSCVGYALYRIILMLTSHRNYAPTAAYHPYPTPCTSPGVGLASLEGSHCTQFGGPGGSKPLAPKEVSSSLGTKSRHLPPSGLRKSWSNQLPTPAPSDKGLWDQGVFGHFSLCLKAISFPLSVLSIARLWRLLPDRCSVPGSNNPAYPQSPPGFSRLQQPPAALQASPGSMVTLARAPQLCPREWMQHSRSHSRDMLCQMCKSTPQPLLSLRGCGLAAPGWEMEGGSG